MPINSGEPKHMEMERSEDPQAEPITNPTHKDFKAPDGWEVLHDDPKLPSTGCCGTKCCETKNAYFRPTSTANLAIFPLSTKVITLRLLSITAFQCFYMFYISFILVVYRFVTHHAVFCFILLCYILSRCRP